VVRNIYLLAFFAALTNQLVGIVAVRELSEYDFAIYTVFNSALLFGLPIITFGIQRVIRIRSNYEIDLGNRMISDALFKSMKASLLTLPLIGILMYFSFDLRIVDVVILLFSIVFLGLQSILLVKYELNAMWSKRQFILFLGGLLIFLSVLVLSASSYASVSRLIGVSCFAVIFLVLNASYFYAEREKILFKDIVLIGLPLALISVGDNFLFLIDKKILLTNANSSEVALYGAYLIIFNLVSLSYKPMAPIIEKLIIKKKVSIRHVCYFLVLVFIGVFFVWLLSENIFEYVYDYRYNLSTNILLKVYILAVVKVVRDIMRTAISTQGKLYGSLIFSVAGLVIYMLSNPSNAFQGIDSILLCYCIMLVGDGALALKVMGKSLFIANKN